MNQLLIAISAFILFFLMLFYMKYDWKRRKKYREEYPDNLSADLDSLFKSIGVAFVFFIVSIFYFMKFFNI